MNPYRAQLLWTLSNNNRRYKANAEMPHKIGWVSVSILSLFCFSLFFFFAHYLFYLLVFLLLLRVLVVSFHAYVFRSINKLFYLLKFPMSWGDFWVRNVVDCCRRYLLRIIYHLSAWTVVNPIIMQFLKFTKEPTKEKVRSVILVKYH